MNNEELFSKFLTLICQACQKVGENYFTLPQEGHENVYRERVYAYELYHILRTELERDSTFSGLSLNGEINKSGRTDFSKEQPDMILHCPGNMLKNIAIVEIKTCQGTDIDKAIQNLKIFTTTYKYSGGILLVFGEKLVPKIKKVTIPDKCVHIWHKKPGETGGKVYQV